MDVAQSQLQMEAVGLALSLSFYLSTLVIVARLKTNSPSSTRNLMFMAVFFLSSLLQILSLFSVIFASLFMVLIFLVSNCHSKYVGF